MEKEVGTGRRLYATRRRALDRGSRDYMTAVREYQAAKARHAAPDVLHQLLARLAVAQFGEVAAGADGATAVTV